MEVKDYLEEIVDGKPVKEWLQSDEGLVDYEKAGLLKNISASKEFIIGDLGEYYIDPSVGLTTWRNGVDLARVVACLKFKVPYNKMRFTTAMEGDDYVRSFFYGYPKAGIEDFIVYFFQLIDGDIYISETTHHVYVKGRNPNEEQWKAAVDVLATKR